MTLVIIVAIALALFSLAFITKRRFGVLGLGLAAGAVLAEEWSRDVGRFLEATDSPVEPLSVTTAATVILILVPALLLLIGGPKYAERRGALIGSLLFALLGTMLLIGPLTTDLPTMDGGVKPALDFVAKWQNLLIAGGIAIAIVDMLSAHGPKLSGRGKSKH
jgi:hypothetical protein